MTAYEQRSYPGAAADTLLNADLAAGGLSFSVTPGTGAGYPDGSSGPFFVILDYDNSKAEKVRCTGRVNDTFTIPDTGSRGVDGTTAVAHTANAKVRAVWTATDAQEANRAAANTIGRITSKGDLTPGTGANTTGRLAVGPDGTLLVADSTQSTGMRYTTSLTGITLDGTSSLGGITGAVLAGAFTAFTPTLTAGNTLGNGVTAGRWKQYGKLVVCNLYWTLGSTSVMGQFGFNLPAASQAGAFGIGVAWMTHGSSEQTAAVVLQSTTAARVGGPATTATVPWTWASGDSVNVTLIYEAA